MHRRNKAPNKTKPEVNHSGRKIDAVSVGVISRYAFLAILVIIGVFSLTVLSSEGGGGNTSEEAYDRVLTTTSRGVVTEEEKSLRGKEPRKLPSSLSEGGKLFRVTVSNLDGEEGHNGAFLVRTRPSWSPRGVERFETLVKSSFWTDCRFFRVVPNFIAQFGINGNPQVQSQWRSKNLLDDPVKVSNKRGTITFATSGKDTRTTQLFINFKDNKFLDQQGFSPFGEVVKGMPTVVDHIFNGYREKPNQNKIQNRGNEYLQSEFPKLTYISEVKIVEDEEAGFESTIGN